MPSDPCGRVTTPTKPNGCSLGGPPPEPEHLPCPRCDSTNTKFCYYNNYNFSQPRHFCKGCRRYWTHGGTLRDIPVGGGSRKNAKRSRVNHNVTNTCAISCNNNGSSGGLGTTTSSCGGGIEYRHMGPPLSTPILLPGVSMSMCDSFTSLLNSTNGPGGFFGLGFEDAGFGIGRAIWPFSGMGASVGGGGDHGGVYGGGNASWQVGNGGESGVGGGECFTLPELAISTPGMI